MRQTSLADSYYARQARSLNRVVVRGNAGAVLTSAPRRVAEDLFTSQGGTAYPLFIVGLHDPDDVNVNRWVL